MACGAILLVVRDEANDYLGSEKDCKDEYDDADSAVLKAADMMCTTACPCDITASNAIKIGLDGDYRQGSASKIQDCNPCEDYEALTDEEQAQVNIYVSQYADSSFTTCSDSYDDFKDIYFTDDQQDYFDMIDWAEEFFDCGGLCTNPGRFLFSDINK